MTINTPLDHDDFVKTLIDSVYELLDIEKPMSGRNGRNIFKLFDTPDNLKLSASLTLTMLELRRGETMWRGSMSSKAKSKYFTNVLYPTCLIDKGAEPTKNHQANTSDEDHLISRGLRRIRMFSYLANHNRLWNNILYNDCSYNTTDMTGTLCQMELMQ